MPLPISETVTPDTQADVADLLRRAHDTATPVYPVGGGTALDFGMPAKKPGWGISTAGLKRVVDYPSRDMTITVEAGMTMSELSQTLASERQRLPIDAAQSDTATIGGVVATNFSGPRRFGSGTVRDYVIGISAVDGRGVAFKGGGRVVKNVAGYDFCKLLTGSLGTLAVITQVTFKVRPIPDATAILTCGFQSLDDAEKLLAQLVHSQTNPSAIELVMTRGLKDTWHYDGHYAIVDSGTRGRIIVGFEGIQAEVNWMLNQLEREWRETGVEVEPLYRFDEPREAAHLLDELAQFQLSRDSSLVVKVAVPPSQLCRMVAKLEEVNPEVFIQAHAGNGVILASFPNLKSTEASNAMIKRIHPAAVAAGGSAVVWSSSSPDELTRPVVWGMVRDETFVMQSVKQQFDPKGLLNPGRFVYP